MHLKQFLEQRFFSNLARICILYTVLLNTVTEGHWGTEGGRAKMATFVRVALGGLGFLVAKAEPAGRGAGGALGGHRRDEAAEKQPASQGPCSSSTFVREGMERC